MNASQQILDDVRALLTAVLGLEGPPARLTSDTRLFGSIPELDSLAVVELASALEQKFDIVIDDEDFTQDVFDTVGSLAEFIGRSAR